VSRMSDLAPQGTLPERIIVVPAAAFADDWPLKPTEEVAIGLRRLSQNDEDTARREAEREAVGFYQEFEGHSRRPDMQTVEDVQADALMCNAVGRLCTDPNDVSRFYFRGQGDQTRDALTPQGARRIFDEYRIFTLGSGVGKPRATDEEIQKLALALAEGAVTINDEARMLLAYLAQSLGIDELRELPDAEDGGAPQYVLRGA
jgi:hypothetical protein